MLLYDQNHIPFIFFLEGGHYFLISKFYDLKCLFFVSTSTYVLLYYLSIYSRLSIFFISSFVHVFLFILFSSLALFSHFTFCIPLYIQIIFLASIFLPACLSSNFFCLFVKAYSPNNCSTSLRTINSFQINQNSHKIPFKLSVLQ